jgi:hypothetical protein
MEDDELLGKEDGLRGEEVTTSEEEIGTAASDAL